MHRAGWGETRGPKILQKKNGVQAQKLLGGKVNFGKGRSLKTRYLKNKSPQRKV